MEGAMRVAGRRHTGRFLRALPALLAAVLTGCANELVVAHNEPHVASDTTALVVETSIRSGDQLVLHVFRERQIVTEQEYWRQRKAETSGLPVTLVTSPASQRVASAEWLGLLQPEGIYVAFVIVVYVIGVPATYLAAAVTAIANGAGSLLGVSTFDEQRTVVRNASTTRERCYAVTVERADGSGLVVLGKQPDSGYVLDAATIDLLGGPGDVVLRDGDLSTPFNLERPR